MQDFFLHYYTEITELAIKSIAILAMRSESY